MMPKRPLTFGILGIIIGVLGIALTAQNFSIRRGMRYDESPGPFIFHHTGGWLTKHPIPPGAPTGAAAIGSTGTAQAHFVDIAAAAGLHYQWRIGGPRPIDILQGIGNGCAFLDYDNSGNLSVLLVGPRLALFKGDGHGHFTDVTHATGLDRFSGHFLGCAVGDYDGDGYDDLYISGYRTGLLLHNEKGKFFMDVTAKAGLTPQPWGTSCAFAETVPGSGRLDLFVGNYVQFDPKTSLRLCNDGQLNGVCGPDVYRAEHGVFYQNLGGGRFRDTSRLRHMETGGKNLGAAFADYNDSGRQSLYVANDRLPGELFKNLGRKFSDVGVNSGTAFDSHVRSHSGMGVDWGDYNNDGKIDLAVMTFQAESKCVFRNLGLGLFEEVSDSLTLWRPTQDNVAFGCKWADFGNDGWLDLMIANGAVRDNIALVDKFTSFRQPMQLFHNDLGRLFVDLSDKTGPDLERPIIGRGLAVGDFDNDGRMDALAVDSEGRPVLLHNESTNVGHWLSLTLVGTRSNRDGYGALVIVRTPGLTQTRLCHADGSYLSSSDKRIHIGLGTAARAQIVTVRWPSGHADTFRDVPADHLYTLQEGAARLKMQAPPHDPISPGGHSLRGVW